VAAARPSVSRWKVPSSTAIAASVATRAQCWPPSSSPLASAELGQKSSHGSPRETRLYFRKFTPGGAAMRKLTLSLLALLFSLLYVSPAAAQNFSGFLRSLSNTLSGAGNQPAPAQNTSATATIG